MSDLTTGLRLGESCPKWEGCNAAFCPAVGGLHLRGERVCLYLREAVKTDGEARVRATLPGELAEVVLRAAQGRILGRDALGEALKRASLTGSKLEAGRRLVGIT
jgi:hypothetical protein